MSALPIRGVFSAAFTAFRPNGEVDLARTAAHARGLIDAGCDGIALLGTTGEANSLSLDERRAVLDATIAGGVDAARLIPGTGVCSIPETIALTRHALAGGVRQVLLLPPFYYPSPSEDGLYAHYARVIDGCGPDVRVLLYHIPMMTGVPITTGLIARLTADFPGVIVGVKDSSGDFDHMRALVADFPGLAVFAGADHLLGPLLRAGGAGCITATSNLIAPWLADLARRIARGEPAADTQPIEDRIATARNLSQRWPQLPVLKAMLAQLTGQANWANVRPPWLPLDAPTAAQAQAAFAEALPELTELYQTRVTA